MKKSVAFIVEESSVDPRTSTMTTRTMNLSHAKLMRVTETQTYRAHFSDPSKTVVETDVQVVSHMGWLSTRIERFGVKSFKDNTLR
ncbi:MAG: PRELI-like family-domain-containing protein, partial [Olpidium bornovanus]